MRPRLTLASLFRQNQDRTEHSSELLICAASSHTSHDPRRGLRRRLRHPGHHRPRRLSAQQSLPSK